MAEIGLIASIVGLVGAGAKLSIAIFDLASSIGSAGKDLQALGTEISLLCAVLEQLQALLETAHFQPTGAAIKTAQRIVDECAKVCQEIDDILAGLRTVHENELFPSVDFTNKVKWTFSKKSKCLVQRATLESCKLTLSVMLNTMLLAERRSQRTQATEVDIAAEQRHKSMTQSLIISQQCAVDQLEHYEDEVEKEDEVAARLPVSDAATRPNDRTRRRSRGRLIHMFSGLSLITNLPNPATTPRIPADHAKRKSIWLDSILAPDHGPSSPHPGTQRKKRMSSAGTANAPNELLHKWTNQGDEIEADVAASQELPSNLDSSALWKASRFSFSGGTFHRERVNATAAIAEQPEPTPGLVKQYTDLVSPRTQRIQSLGFHVVAGMNGTLESSSQLVRTEHGHDSYDSIAAIILKEYASPVKPDDVVLCVSYGGKTKILKSTDKPLEVLQHYEELELDPRVFIRVKTTPKLPE